MYYTFLDVLSCFLFSWLIYLFVGVLFCFDDISLLYNPYFLLFLLLSLHLFIWNCMVKNIFKKTMCTHAKYILHITRLIEHAYAIKLLILIYLKPPNRSIFIVDQF